VTERTGEYHQDGEEGGGCERVQVEERYESRAEAALGVTEVPEDAVESYGCLLGSWVRVVGREE